MFGEKREATLQSKYTPAKTRADIVGKLNKGELDKKKWQEDKNGLLFNLYKVISNEDLPQVQL